MEAFYGILIPFLGTSLGAACVFFMRKTLSAEQYAKYAALMNLTLLNKGIDLSK